MTKLTDADRELLAEAANHLLGLGLSVHTNPIPRAQAKALDLAERLRALVADPRDEIALSARVGRWPV